MSVTTVSSSRPEAGAAGPPSGQPPGGFALASAAPAPAPAASAPMAVPGAAIARAGVRVNIFDLGVAPRPPQDPFSRGVRALADGIGHVVGELAGIPEGTPAQRDAPMVVHALSRAGFPVGPTGDVWLPDTRQAGAFLADLVVQGHAPGDPGLTPGVHGLLGFSDPQRLRQAGFGEAFVEGFRERSRAIANQGGVASATALFGLAGGVAGARNAPRPTTIVIEDGVPGGARPPAGGPRPPAGGLGGREPIRLVEVAPGHYARPETAGAAGSGAIVPSSGGALARPGAGGALAPTNPGALGAATALPGAAAFGPALAPSATGPLAPGRPADAGALHGPGNPEGIARMRAEAARREAALAADLDRRAAAIPVPRVADGADVTSGRVSWEAAGEAARAHNAGGDPLDVVVRVPVDRDYGDARRREVGLLRGDALQIQNQVSAMQASGRIPAGFDLPGAAAQAGVDWPGAVRAAADRRAYALAAEHPLVLNGGRTVAFPSRAAALAETAAFNRASSGADPVALYVPVNRTVGAGSARATGVAHEVYVGDPAALRATYRSLLDQGRVADGASFDEAIARSGVSGSLPGRAAASRDLRAAADEVRHPTTLFGSTVGVNPTPGEADAAAVAINRQAGPGDPWALSVPLLRPVSGPGLPEGARGTAHAVYVNDPRYLRGFYDEMNRQGRIPDGVSFDDLLARSGVAGRYAERERARAAAPADFERGLERAAPPAELDRWRRFAEAHPDVADLVRRAGAGADDETVAEAARRMTSGRYAGQDVVAFLRDGGFDRGGTPPGGGTPPAPAAAPEPEDRRATGGPAPFAVPGATSPDPASVVARQLADPDLLAAYARSSQALNDGTIDERIARLIEAGEPVAVRAVGGGSFNYGDEETFAYWGGSRELFERNYPQTTALARSLGVNPEMLRATMELGGRTGPDALVQLGAVPPAENPDDPALRNRFITHPNAYATGGPYADFAEQTAAIATRLYRDGAASQDVAKFIAESKQHFQIFESPDYRVPWFNAKHPRASMNSTVFGFEAREAFRGGHPNYEATMQGVAALIDRRPDQAQLFSFSRPPSAWIPHERLSILEGQEQRGDFAPGAAPRGIEPDLARAVRDRMGRVYDDPILGDRFIRMPMETPHGVGGALYVYEETIRDQATGLIRHRLDVILDQGTSARSPAGDTMRAHVTERAHEALDFLADGADGVATARELEALAGIWYDLSATSGGWTGGGAGTNHIQIAAAFELIAGSKMPGLSGPADLYAATTTREEFVRLFMSGALFRNGADALRDVGVEPAPPPAFQPPRFDR